MLNHWRTVLVFVILVGMILGDFWIAGHPQSVIFNRTGRSLLPVAGFGSLLTAFFLTGWERRMRQERNAVRR